MKRCVICGRQVKRDEFCAIHAEAEHNLRLGFHKWQDAMSIEWDKYLSKLEKLDETGKWIREVIDYFNSKGTSSEY